MRVRIEITGILRKPSGQAQLELELPENATASQAIAELGYREQERKALRFSRAGEVLTPGGVLREGDRLLLFAAVGGG